MKLSMTLCTALAVSGCAIGAGTSTVGIWRPQRVVDTQVCVQEKPGTCTRSVEVARDIPARSFGGGVFAWFNPGYLRLGGDAGSRSMFVADSHYEYLRGRGGVAVGGRIGANMALGSDRSLLTVPVTVVGHWGYPRVSVYAGVGYTPYARLRMDGDPATTLRGFHMLAGARALLRANRSSRMTTSIDLFQYFLQGVVATSATTAICLHF